MNSTVNDLISRRSVRKYKKEQISREEMDTVIMAGMYAPTGKNMQSPVIVAVTDPEEISYLSKLNSLYWSSDVDPFYGAPAVLIVLADINNYNHVYDGALVMGNMMNAAHAIGLGSCWINRAKEVFASEEGKAWLAKHGIEGELEGIGHCILGYPDGPLRAPAPRKDKYVYYVG